MSNLAGCLLHLFGWSVVSSVPELPKSVICAAPHTSNFDFVWGKLAYAALGRKTSFLIKSEWFRFPFNLIFGPLGGVPVSRSRRTDLVEQMRQEFEKRPTFTLAITPEGTRKYNHSWKKGFYYIALAAKVPIVLAYVDYKKKEVGFGKVIIPGGNIKEDMSIINNFYANVTPKYPKLFALNKG